MNTSSRTKKIINEISNKYKNNDLVISLYIKLLSNAETTFDNTKMISWEIEKNEDNVIEFVAKKFIIHEIIATEILQILFLENLISIKIMGNNLFLFIEDIFNDNGGFDKWIEHQDYC